MLTYNRRHEYEITPRPHVELNGVARIGLILALTGLIAFGAYTAFFLAGFISDLMR